MASLLVPLSLWAKIDSYLLTLVTNWCAGYIELENAQIEVGEQFNPDAVDLPFILIRGYERKMQEAQPEFGDGLYHLDGLTYPYEFVVTAAFESMADAKNFACNVSASLTVALATDPTLGGLAAADGEYVQQFNYDDGEIYVRGMNGQQPEGKYSGTACVRIEIVTER